MPNTPNKINRKSPQFAGRAASTNMPTAAQQLFPTRARAKSSTPARPPSGLTARFVVLALASAAFVLTASFAGYHSSVGAETHRCTEVQACQ